MPNKLPYIKTYRVTLCLHMGKTRFAELLRTYQIDVSAHTKTEAKLEALRQCLPNHFLDFYTPTAEPRADRWLLATRADWLGGPTHTQNHRNLRNKSEDK